MGHRAKFLLCMVGLLALLLPSLACGFGHHDGADQYGPPIESVAGQPILLAVSSRKKLRWWQYVLLVALFALPGVACSFNGYDVENIVGDAEQFGKILDAVNDHAQGKGK